MPTRIEMSRAAKESNILERKIIQWVNVHRLAPLRRIAKKFNISELHAFKIIEEGAKSGLELALRNRLLRRIRTQRSEAIENLTKQRQLRSEIENQTGRREWRPGP
jgi:predicted transcriptional regulator